MNMNLRVLCALCLLCALGRADHPQTSRLSAYELTVPRRIEKEKRDLGNVASDKVSYVIHAQGKDHIVVLEKNNLLLPKDFTMYFYTKDGSLITESPFMENHCHYRGYVQDVDDSAVALSICSGLRGMLHLPGVSYGIEPLEESSSFQHLVYRLEDVQGEPLVCGTLPEDQEHDLHAEQIHKLHAPSSGPLPRRKRAVLQQTHYVELFLVVDNDRFNFRNRNQTVVREEMVELANYIDGMYKALNIRIVLVGLEIWNQGNQISTDGSAGEVLHRFVQWKQRDLLPRRRHDSAQLILKKGFGSTAGMAYVGTVCSQSLGGGINVFSNVNTQQFASIVAHELGHNLGMSHDDGRGCHCAVSSCIMNSGATGSRNFSSCSADDFEKLILGSRGRCLLNSPRPEEAYSTPYCGNKLVDVGEECDCGTEVECKNDPCCEPKTCKLKSWAQCADGACCKNCRFLSAGSMCRATNDECDLPEYCNGTSSVCQSDSYKKNGHQCRSGTAYCYNGKCKHYDGQCQAIFGPKAKAAPEVCFHHVNLMGDRFGNCGFQGNSYKKCASSNAMCGKLQCENVQMGTIFGIEPSFIQTPAGGTKCWGVDFQLGSDVPDPGMVNEGTICAENKVCLNYECVSADLLKYDCDTQQKCHGHGVCNSNNNCHCDDGWAPSDCKNRGYGGSVDSGPTWNDKDTSTRDGLLVFFFLVLPMLVLGVYVYLKRDALRRRFCRGSSGRNSRGAANSNRRSPQRNTPGNIVKDGHQAQLLPSQEVVQTNRTASVPSYAPPPRRPQPPMKTQLVPQRHAPPPPL
ncbi:disintegrin and metalloproteinase domain-containing protein 9 isoform X3 [Brienomyrus brachyistius]|uniref:disintegrin and metalloproteinase domain-containing protein 9 isoform X3 n=1 Tax=Brienomyrus brachyistius TaxID=42636 RepID=UPI0020B1B127|nr:disintegrin and metalloproteinase domain-containing protein 9 isoform X3 [Brienomyrus brachyistius]